MRIVCSGCKKLMGHKPGPGNLPSHSICRDCLPKLYPEIPIFPEVEKEWKELEAQDGKE
jgi:hypothetical protein